MCVSPHEMTAQQLQTEIDWLKQAADDASRASGMRSYYERRLARMEALLKEKAESGEMV